MTEDGSRNYKAKEDFNLRLASAIFSLFFEKFNFMSYNNNNCF